MSLNEDRSVTDAADSEEDLILRASRDRSESAFEELMARHGDRIYRVIRRQVPDDETAMDLTQETFLKAWRALEGFQGQAAFFTWIYRIARNAVSSEYRRRANRPRLVSFSGDKDDESDGAADLADQAAGPEGTAMVRERQGELLEALKALVPDFREIILLRDVEGMSYEDLAELLEVPLGTVRSRLHRARLELKAMMERTEET